MDDEVGEEDDFDAACEVSREALAEKLVGLSRAVMEYAREGGLLLGKGGLHGNVLRVAPPLSLTQDEADEGYAILERAVERAAAGE